MAIKSAQLEKVLQDRPVQIIERFCELMPDVPWTNQLVDDMFEEFTYRGLLQIPAVAPEGVGRVQAYMCETLNVPQVRGQAPTKTIQAWLGCWIKPGRPNEVPREYALEVKKAVFPYTPQGFKEAVRHLQEAQLWLFRRGFCRGCVTNEPPVKRIRLSTQPYCTTCLLQSALVECPEASV